MYHPSQQIKPEYEALYSKAILQSLSSTPPMIGSLPESSPFAPKELPPSTFESSNLKLRFNQKLGHLYEEAFYLLSSHDDRYKILSKNLQLITEDKNTLGELDFLFWDTLEKSYIHLEVAVKFYLILQEEDTFHYPGPDARDNYHRKLERMRNHQLILTRRPEIQEQLHQLTNGSTIAVHHCVQGIFFDHISADEKPTPPFANPDCQRRLWLHCRELPLDQTSYRIVPKPLWLCNIDDELFDTLVEVTREELLELAQQRCTMFITSPNDPPQFLAPDTWPNH